MKVTVVPLTSFAHDNIDAHEGKPFPCEKGLAEQLEARGLVRIKRPPVEGILPKEPTKPAAELGPKVPDDGGGPPSSASRAAPVSPTTTSPPSAPGAKRGRRASGG